MSYDGKLMRLAQQKFETDKAAREQRFRARREAIFQAEPRLKEVDASLRSTASRIIATALRHGTDPATAVAALREENLALQEERKELLRRLGLEEDALEERPDCPFCNDSGFRGGSVCRCLRAYYAKEQQKELSRMLDLGSQSFDTFSLDWYTDQSTMQVNYDICVEYAHNFGKQPGNLLLFGNPGLGKTHLSAAIAREVSERGFSVVYDTAAHVFERFETQKFSRDNEEADTDVERILSCDLLILDDLGTEMTTAFVQSALYTVINTRLREKRSTIISTNLRPSELTSRYSPQVASRVEGEYQFLPFVGEDIRKLKKNTR